MSGPPGRLGRVLSRFGRPVLLLAGLAAIAYLFYEIGPRVIWESIRTLGWRLVIVITLPYALAVVLDTLGWRVLVRGHDVPFGALLRARLAGEAVNLLTPTASVGGEPLKAYLIRLHVPLSEGLASVVADKTTVVIGQILLLPLGLFLATSILPASHPLLVAMSALFAVEALAVGAFVVVQTLGVFGGGGRVLGRLGKGPTEEYQRGLNEVDQWLAKLYRQRRGRVAAVHPAPRRGLDHRRARDLPRALLPRERRLADRLAHPRDVRRGDQVRELHDSGVARRPRGRLRGDLRGAGATRRSRALVHARPPLRELLWAGIGLLWLAALRARPTFDGDGAARRGDEWGRRDPGLCYIEQLSRRVMNASRL